jgi:RNA polymerase sigma-70 factor (ECF subfamily)
MDESVQALTGPVGTLPLTQVGVHDSRDCCGPLTDLVREYLSAVYRLLGHLGVPHSDLDDATQQVFMIVADKLSHIQPGSERAFITSVTARIASRWRRTHRRRKEKECAGDEWLEQSAAPEPSPEQHLQLAEAQRMLLLALDALPDPQREVFVLFEIEELTLRDIAEALAVPQGTVASRLRAARDQFHRAVTQLQSAAARGRSR